MEEKKKKYYERLAILKDEDDDVIDRLTEFLSRNIILINSSESFEREENIIPEVNNDATRDSAEGLNIQSFTPNANDEFSTRVDPSKRVSPTRDSAEGQNVQYKDLFQSLKEYIDQSLAKQNELNESRMQTLLLNFSELKETQKVVINKLDTLIDILDPRRSHTDEQEQTFDTDNANHYVSPHHGLITEVQETSNLEQSIDEAILMSICDPGRETYITPGTIVYDGQEDIERGDEVTSVMVRGRELQGSVL